MRRTVLAMLVAGVACGDSGSGKGQATIGTGSETETDSSASTSSSSGTESGTGPTTQSTTDTSPTTTMPTSTTDTTGPGEDCGDGVVQPDEECDDGNSIDADGCNHDCVPSGKLLWSETVAGGFAEVDDGFDVAVDSQENLYVTGYVAAAGSFRDLWLRKYSSIGGMLWTQTYAGPGGGNDQGRGLAVDADDNLYVAGYYNEVAQGANTFLRKYTSDGTELWTRVYNGANNGTDVLDAVTIDADANVVVAGYHNVLNQDADIWLRKYDPDGAVLWTRSYTGPSALQDIAFGVAAAPNGDLYVVGWETITNEGRNMWLGKYDVDGNLLWTRTHNGPESLNDILRGVLVDADNNVYVSGYEDATAYPWRLWMRKYDSAGIIVWTDTYTGETDEGVHAERMAWDLDGNIIVTGGEVFVGARRMFIRKYTSDGDVLWTVNADGAPGGLDYARAAVTRGDKHIYVTGAMDVGVDDRDIWIGRFTP